MQKLIDKLAWIEIQDKKILTTKSFGKDKLYIPGGKRELGETDDEALLREIKEELDVNLSAFSLKLVGVFEAQAHGQPDGVIVRMTCYTGQYEGELKACSEIEEIQWLRWSDKDKTSHVDHLIFDFLKQQGLLE